MASSGQAKRLSDLEVRVATLQRAMQTVLKWAHHANLASKAGDDRFQELEERLCLVLGEEWEEQVRNAF